MLSCWRSPFVHHEEPVDRMLHQNWLFLIAPAKGTPFCMVMWAEQAQCSTTTLEEQTLERSATEEVPWNMYCLLLAQQQTVETPLGWVNRKLCAIVWMFPEHLCWIKGEKFDVEGPGVWGRQHQFSGGRGTDHTGEACMIQLAMINSTPPLFILEIASSWLRGHEMGVLACTLIFGWLPCP